ncbi:PREDICTED: RING-H2 finger protein ATL52-like [Nelumbo nucifera]|uniref:RING-type E3 ubiquitin transferase n=2 Tax=Nelumbo nucifera TaxID=4432 RepID=A0A1U7ZVD1_NELNU|nr:PREDICTED: RING-H2 finger protein ATL52-like [Nelumbo nucifera]DAD38685.1 TPA_asm: hypothetical protein HUJ06_013007 [Nelumbo nucifera]
MDENRPRPQEIDFYLSPATLAIVGILSAILVLTIYHCITVGWCNQRQTTSAGSERRREVFRAEQEETTNSVGSRMIQIIPAQRYTKEVREDGTCAVCLCEFMEGEEVRILPQCMHSFHVPCIDMWLYSHSNCPLCRNHIVRPQLESEILPLPDAQRVPDFGERSTAL